MMGVSGVIWEDMADEAIIYEWEWNGFQDDQEVSYHHKGLAAMSQS